MRSAGWEADRRTLRYELLERDDEPSRSTPLLDAARVQPGMRVLDVRDRPWLCCRTRRRARGYRRGDRLLDDDAGSRAFARAGSASFVEGDATSLPFADESFDAVISAVSSSSTSATPERAVAEAVRVVASGGRVALHGLGHSVTGAMARRHARRGCERLELLHLCTSQLGRRSSSSRTTTVFRALLVEGGLVEVAIETIDDTLEIAGSQERSGTAWPGRHRPSGAPLRERSD